MAFNASAERLLHEPALDTPPGLHRHMSTQSPEQAGVYVCSVLVAVVPGTLLCLRLYTKLRILRRSDWTDYLTVIAYLMLIAMLAIGRFCLSAGGGAHQWNITLEQFHRVVFWAWVNEILYSPVISIIKTVILLQYIRLFAPNRSVDPLLFFASWTLIALIVLWNFACFWVSIFACSPVEKFWNTLITDGKCLNFSLNILLTCLFNIITDVVILILPSRAVWRLRIPLKKKFAIVSLFGIGLIACIANAMVILYVSRQDGSTADISYNVAWMGLWAYAEIGLGIIVICTLSLPKFIEVKGKKVRIFLSGITRPFSSRSGGSWDKLQRSKTSDFESMAPHVDETTHPKTIGSASVFRLDTLSSFNGQDEVPKAYKAPI
ncbi:MAG: hypothetical protein LQ339_008189 [Xanthoria mediterranea]|nr:MAG: hypothetical protein LQ339_008189 [Xanthoria mediterranea]